MTLGLTSLQVEFWTFVFHFNSCFPCFPFCIVSSIKHGLTGARVFLLGQVTVVGFIVVTSMTIILLITKFKWLTQSIWNTARALCVSQSSFIDNSQNNYFKACLPVQGNTCLCCDMEKHEFHQFPRILWHMVVSPLGSMSMLKLQSQSRG